MRHFEFTLSISAPQTRRIYAGAAQYVLAEDRQGLKLRLPAANFRDHVDADGIHGRFVVTVDDDYRIVALRRLGGAPASR